MSKTPKYEKPPVVETVMGVQFPEIENFRAVHFGLFWERISEGFPNPSDQPRLEPVREVFPRALVVPGVRFQSARRYPVDRVWFTSDSDAELIQLQPDRFLFNWRQRKGQPYPTYDHNSGAFFENFEKFREFCREQSLSEPRPELCEVTYVNHIRPEGQETIAKLAETVFTGLRWQTNEGFPPEPPESVTFNRAFMIRHGGKPIGRLYAEASVIAQREDAGWKELLLFKLTARVNHDPAAELKDSLQIAHDWVVNGFAGLTSREIQEGRWRRKA